MAQSENDAYASMFKQDNAKFRNWLAADSVMASLFLAALAAMAFSASSKRESAIVAVSQVPQAIAPVNDVACIYGLQMQAADVVSCSIPYSIALRARDQAQSRSFSRSLYRSATYSP